MEYHYQIEKINQDIIRHDWIDITGNITEDEQAVIIAILSFIMKVNVGDMQIDAFYKIGG